MRCYVLFVSSRTIPGNHSEILGWSARLIPR